MNSRSPSLPRTPSSFREWALELAPLLPALLLLLATSSPGIALTPDSRQYLVAAESLSRDGTLGSGALYWPPLYPALLSLHSWFGLDAPGFAAVLDRIFFAATVLGAWAIGRRAIASRLSLAFGLLAIACLSHSTMVFGHLWSETLYLPLCTWLSYAWARRLSDSSRAALVAACVLLALAMLTRHVGVVWPVAMAITALVYSTSSKRLANLAAICVACVPYALWEIRTYFVSGTYAGPRVPVAHPDLAMQAELYGRTLGHWMFPHAYPQAGGLAIAAFVLLALGVSLLSLLRDARATQAPDFRSCFLFLVLLFVAGHSLLTIWSATRVRLDVDARTLYPIFWPLLFACICAAESATRRLADANSRRVFAFQALLLLYCLAWISAPNALIDALV